MAKQGTFSNVTRRACPPTTSAFTRTRPAGVSSVKLVTGSWTSTMRLSIRTVVTQMVLVPDIGGYSTCSMMTKPAAAAGLVGGSTRLQLAAG